MTANATAPAPAATETGANTLHPEGTTVPDSTDTGPGTHRPITLHYSTERVSVVPEPIGDRPTVSVLVDTSTLTASASLTAGPMRLRYTDSATARTWASALQELAAQLEIAEGHAADLRNTETDAAAEPDDDQGNDYSALIEAEYERQDHADDAALAANDELRKADLR